MRYHEIIKLLLLLLGAMYNTYMYGIMAAHLVSIQYRSRAGHIIQGHHNEYISMRGMTWQSRRMNLMTS